MLSALTKRRLLQIIPFGIVSMFSGLVFALIEQGVLGEAISYPSTGNPYHFTPFTSALFSGIAGLLVGTLEISLFSKLFNRNSFLRKIILKTLLYAFLVCVVTLLVSLTNHAIEESLPVYDKKVLSFGFNFLNNFAFISVTIYVSLGIGFCLFYTEISDNIGQGVLLNFFTGKYHRPKEEERIFMFLDMKDSTAIAEKLGHVRYFEMLREYYADLTQPIINFNGQIYQYVGDEVVVTWKKEKGIDDNNCLNCFFAMKKALSSQHEKYQHKYGLAPTFKAGMHLGQVTTGEIGVIKKDIVFTGDVLNTTARVQGLCNQLGSDLLVSEQLINALGDRNKYSSELIGEAELRGRNEKIRLYSVKAT